MVNILLWGGNNYTLALLYGILASQEPKKEKKKTTLRAQTTKLSRQRAFCYPSTSNFNLQRTKVSPSVLPLSIRVRPSIIKNDIKTTMHYHSCGSGQLTLPTDGSYLFNKSSGKFKDESIYFCKIVRIHWGQGQNRTYLENYTK